MQMERAYSPALIESLGRYVSKAKEWSFWNNKIFRLLTYILLISLAFVFLYPFLYMIVTSLKSPTDLMDSTVQWIPTSIFLNNYVSAVSALEYARHFANSVLVTLLCTIGHLIVCSFIAYGFSRYDFPGKKLFFMLVVLTIIMPIQVLIIPEYLQYAKMKWLDTYFPLILPTLFGFGLRGGLFIFIFRQFFAGMPRVYEEAAKVDGYNFINIFFRIMLPTAKSTILVCTILSMIWHWNDYFEPSLYLRLADIQLLPQRLPAMYEMSKITDYLKGRINESLNEGVVMAATFLSIVPILLVYLVLQRKFVEGIEHTGHTE